MRTNPLIGTGRFFRTTHSTPGRFAVLLALLACLLGLGLVGVRAASAVQDAPLPAVDAGLTVRLIIDFDNGAQRVYTGLAWTKGMTVLDALKQASEHPQGFALEHRGKGETAFVSGIAGVSNQRTGANPRFWRYWVNTEFATKGAGVQELQPGDVVLWRYGKGG